MKAHSKIVETGFEVVLTKRLGMETVLGSDKTGDTSVASDVMPIWDMDRKRRSLKLEA
jgi:hypothetical protein